MGRVTEGKEKRQCPLGTDSTDKSTTLMLQHRFRSCGNASVSLASATHGVFAMPFVNTSRYPQSPRFLSAAPPRLQNLENKLVSKIGQSKRSRRNANDRLCQAIAFSQPPSPTQTRTQMRLALQSQTESAEMAATSVWDIPQ